MLQLQNRTSFPAHIAVVPDPRGIDTLYVTVKATFTLAPRLEVAAEQVPIVMADEYWGEPGQSSLKYASDVHLTKPSTDVVLIGKVRSPGGKARAQVDASLAVGNRSRRVRAFGDRQWRPGFACIPARMTAPKPFTSMPLVYERAFGGLHAIEGKKQEVLFEERNPVGRGFVGKRRGRALDGLALPNLEDPEHPVKGPKDRPAPTGFGYVAPSWEPRKSYAGTYDEAWLEKRAPYLPKDFDARFFNAASPGFVMGRHLEGGEPVEAVNLSREGPLRFHIPTCRLDAHVTIAGATEEAAMALETVLIEPDDARLSMVWRASVPCDKKALQVERIALALNQLDFDGGSR
jgi:hypothetical protein